MGLKREEGPRLSHFTDGENEDQGGYVTCTPLVFPTPALRGGSVLSENEFILVNPRIRKAL